MQAVARLVRERLGHERGVEVLTTGQRVHHEAQHDEAVGRGEGVGVLEVLLELPVGVLVVVGVVAPSHGIHVPRHRREVVEHRSEATGVVAGQFRRVPLVGRPQRAVLVAVEQRVLGLGSGLQYQVLPGRRGGGALQDDPGGVRPELTLHGGVALHGSHVGLPRQLRVRVRIGNGEDVRIGRRLADGAGSEAGEPGTHLQQVVNGADRHQLGARLAVHLHEHGVDELHAVVVDACLQVIRCHRILLLVPGARGAPLSSLVTAAVNRRPVRAPR